MLDSSASSASFFTISASTLTPYPPCWEVFELFSDSFNGLDVGGSFVLEVEDRVCWGSFEDRVGELSCLPWVNPAT